ncbi:ComF family protein [Flavobacterium sp. HXWNR70]|uniref:ComF family protein n=2 Tax=Flavobacterium luminosum TaxID=2949086 RepID=A0ABT0TL33_9FLAO|nr:ComF family protein [Flavobacterium sp. HXWNR70]MCL9808212.1 ComF family protein [Flavobacterium sp. HXWNR70]
MLEYLINIFYPKTCPGCLNLILKSENQLCTSCRHEIPLTNHLSTKENEAFQKFYGKIPLENAFSMFYFHKKGITQELIHHLKYKKRQEIGTVLGQWYAEDLKQQKVFEEVHYIIPVPLHPKRLKQRGYNQISTFCHAIGDTLNIPVTTDILYRNHYSITQSKKNLEERSSLNTNSFDVNHNEEHHHKHFLLIDDVLTTGATLEACGKAILKIPGAKLSILTMGFSES